ncbi:MAG TPA: amidohydrolase family protein [Candidatus Binatus sp.]|jgi:imidazolonepropionase-like amidohydrolase|nr:amidohydrolase family protein [Candidatus Binatus sp.]
MSARRGRAGVVAVVILVVACGREPLLVTRPAGASRSLVVRNVRVFDAPAAALRDGRWDVVVREGRIAAIERPGAAAPGLPEIDGEGGTLVPGLVDVHTHTGSTANPPWQISLLPNVDATLAAFLYAGVTTVLDLGNLSPAVFGERERLANGAKLGPRLYAAGPVFTAPGGHPAEVLRAWLPWYLRWYVLPRATREVATAEDGRRAVAELLPQHPDILKLAIDAGARDDVPCLAPETIAAITAAGHAGGVRSIAHIGSSAEAVAALRGGVDALAHAPWREELSDQAVAAIAAAHVPVVVTLAIWDAAAIVRAHPSDFLPIEREVARPDLMAALLAPVPQLDPATTAFLRAAAAGHGARRRNVAKLRSAGVRVLAGSDAANPGQLPGAGLHLELVKLVDAGVPPGEALRIATWDNAHFLGGERADFGEIAVGKRADLVLVAGDPTQRIEDLGKISRVILGGAPLERAARP